MKPFEILAVARHKVGDLVLVAVPGEREFSLPGDEDLSSDIHGTLIVRGVQPGNEFDWPSLFRYALAPNSITPSVYLVPEHVLEPVY